MSRRIQTDFAELTHFIEQYSVANRTADVDFLNALSRLHKRYYAVLVFLAELGAVHQRLRSSSAREKVRVSSLYLREFISDLAAALFDWLHGAYKPSRLSLRSGIENLLKGLSVSIDPEITRQKNVYEVFRIAAETPLMRAGEGKRMLGRLRSTYATLCVDAHGGNISQLAQIASFGYFPKFDKPRAEKLAKLYSDLARDGLSLLCLSSTALVRRMHHENADIVMSILPNEVKRALHELD